jgi:hypothetical protein
VFWYQAHLVDAGDQRLRLARAAAVGQEGRAANLDGSKAAGVLRVVVLSVEEAVRACARRDGVRGERRGEGSRGRAEEAAARDAQPGGGVAADQGEQSNRRRGQHGFGVGLVGAQESAEE